MKNLITTLYDFKMKKFGIIIAAIMLIVDLASYLLPDFHFTHYSHHILFHYMVLLGLIMAISSKDKVDDELSRQIRYSIFKNTLIGSVTLIGVSALVGSVFGLEKISTLLVIYYFEVVLVLHLVLYHLGHRYTPKWLLREETTSKRFTQTTIRLMVALLVTVLFLIIITVILAISGEV